MARTVSKGSDMSRIRKIGVGAAMALFVYQGATATDTHVGTVSAAIQATLESEMELEWLGEWFIGGGGPWFVEIPALVGILLLLFGGLPLALFGLLIDQQGSGVLTEWRRSLRVPYAVLMFQIVSMALSVVGLMMGGILLAYFGVQIVASVAVIPVWRRRLAYGISPSAFRRSCSFCMIFGIALCAHR